MCVCVCVCVCVHICTQGKISAAKSAWLFCTFLARGCFHILMKHEEHSMLLETHLTFWERLEGELTIQGHWPMPENTHGLQTENTEKPTVSTKRFLYSQFMLTKRQI